MQALSWQGRACVRPCRGHARVFQGRPFKLAVECRRKDRRGPEIARAKAEIRSDFDWAPNFGPVLPPTKPWAETGAKDILRDSKQDDAGADDSIVYSGHPDAVRRRVASEERKQLRRQMSAACSSGSGLSWWEQISSKNSVLITTSDDYFHSVRTARSDNKDFVVCFFSPKCGACQKHAPMLESVMAANPDVRFIRVNYDMCTLVGEIHGVKKLPWAAFFHSVDKEATHAAVSLKTFSAHLEIPSEPSLPGPPAGQSHGRKASISSQYCAVSNGGVLEVNALWLALHL